jgi:hypothetical protein
MGVKWLHILRVRILVTEARSTESVRSHSRNEAARAAVFTFLRSIGLEPIEWSAAIRMTGEATPYIGDVLNAAFASAQAVVVLQTPDDIAYLDKTLCEADDPEAEPPPPSPSGRRLSNSALLVLRRRSMANLGSALLAPELAAKHRLGTDGRSGGIAAGGLS